MDALTLTAEINTKTVFPLQLKRWVCVAYRCLYRHLHHGTQLVFMKICFEHMGHNLCVCRSVSSTCSFKF